MIKTIAKNFSEIVQQRAHQTFLIVLQYCYTIYYSHTRTRTLPQTSINLPYCSLELWTIISIVMVTFSLLYTAIEYMSENRQTGFLDCINVALGISIGKLPTSTVVRIIFMVFVLYSMHIRIFYQSQLILMLTTPTTEKQITTQEELVAAKIPFGFPRNFEIHLERSNSTNNPYFVQNNKVCTFHSCLKRMATQPFATLGNRMYLEYSIAFEHRNVKFFTITKPVAKSFVEMLMTKGFPLRDKINVKLRKMIEIGYLAASQKYYHKLVANVSIYNHHSYKKFANLQMEHFTSAFLLYITGITASIIAFSVEIFLKHHRQ